MKLGTKLRNGNIKYVENFSLKVLLTGGGFKPNLRVKIRRHSYSLGEKTKIPKISRGEELYRL